MDFYKKLAEHYSEIFPVSDAMLKLAASTSEAGGRVLDVGSAKGELVAGLNKAGRRCTGLEYVRELAGDAADTVIGDMHSIPFADGEFDSVICTGNTLVHSDRPEEVIDEFGRVLRMGGRCLVQILNYGLIMKNRPERLPDINTDGLLFEREYIYKPDRIVFKGRLISRDGVRESDVDLFPLDADGLKEIFEECGFDVEAVYGGFGGEPFYENVSFPLIVSAVKR